MLFARNKLKSTNESLLSLTTLAHNFREQHKDLHNDFIKSLEKSQFIIDATNRNRNIESDPINMSLLAHVKHKLS